jgi:GntR family transcriptional regulator
MFSVDVQSRTPVWEQICNEVRKYIMLGILNPDDRLPSVRELAMETGVNPNTIAKAYSDLVAKGLIVAAGGRGYFVAKDSHAVLLNAAELRMAEFEDMAKTLILSGIEKDTLIRVINQIKK